MNIDSIKREYEEYFVPENYLSNYYADGPNIEMEFILSFIVRKRFELNLKDLLVMEFGGGPSLYGVAAMTPFAKEIHFADYLPNNLNAVKNWIENAPGTFDWSPFIKMTLQKENVSYAADDILHRANSMKKKITHLLKCNALEKEPVNNSALKYDLISALYCTDIITKKLDGWFEIIQNISSMIKSGGWLMLGLTQGGEIENRFHNDIEFPSVELSDEDIKKGYALANFDLSTFQLEKQKGIDIAQYENVLMCIARKK